MTIIRTGIPGLLMAGADPKHVGSMDVVVDVTLNHYTFDNDVCRSVNNRRRCTV